jgi:hypothetical protein
MLSESLILALLMAAPQEGPAALEPLRLEYPALVDGLIDLRWMCQEPRPGEGSDALEARSAGEALEIAHVRGPGIVGRIWCSRADGTLLIHVDGAAEPAVSWKLAEFVSRPESSELPPDPLAGILGSGWYSVLPIPFQQDVRLTWQPSATGSGPVFLQADVRRLGEGVSVPSATAELLRASNSDMQRVARVIADGINPETLEWPNLTQAKAYKKRKVDPEQAHLDGSFDFGMRGTGIIRWIEIWLRQVTNPVDVEREIRALTLRLESGSADPGVPSQLLLEMSLGDLMGSGYGFNPYDQYLHGIRADGHFFLRLPIPYDKNLRLTFSHTTQQGVVFGMRIATDPTQPELVPPMRLRGGVYIGDARGVPALDLPGPARLLSFSWSSQAETDDRWELSPAFSFADYVTHPRNGAWQQVIQRDGPGRFGRSSMFRIFGQDAPIAAAGERLRFAPPATFTGAAGKAQVTSRVLWYGSKQLDGSYGAISSGPERELRPVATPSFHLVPGAIEAEGARIKDLTHGAQAVVEDWSAQAPGVSRKEVLVLRPAQAGDQVLLNVMAEVGGEYELVVRYGRGSGMGSAQVYLDGKKAGPVFDGAADAPGMSEEIVLQRGTFLPRVYTLAIRSVDGKPVAVDYLRLRPVQ